MIRSMSTTQTHETTAVIGPDGSIHIADLPFGTGERVRVVVVPDASSPRRHTAEEIEQSRAIRRSLRGSVLRYDDPFSPAVPIEDWEVLRDTES
jgi:hypothetical protein